MKSLISLFVFYLFISYSSFAQTEVNTPSVKDTLNVSADSGFVTIGDSVNVRSLLDEEIAMVKEKQKAEDLKAQTFVISESKIENEKSVNVVEYFFWGIEFLLVVAIGIFWYKKINLRKKTESKTLKFNISKLREEKIICGLTNDLTPVRRGLTSISINYNDGGRDIIHKARELSISKGEVYLAAKLKLLAGQVK